jgi:D-glycero-D-manno-heptose 1,7-bisphosphate phosphatase
VTAAGRAAVFFDRDGTLIEGPVVDGRQGSIRRADDLELAPGAEQACTALRAAGFPLVVVTNQPDVARGSLSREELDRIHARLRELLPLDEIVACPHDDADRCGCRKPLGGMLVDAAERHGLDLAGSFLVGDSWRDVEAGRRAGCTTVFLDREYSDAVPVEPAVTVRDLGEAAAWILAQRGA